MESTQATPLLARDRRVPRQMVPRLEVPARPGRVDNVYGDRNLVCSCVGMEAYANAPKA